MLLAILTMTAFLRSSHKPTCLVIGLSFSDHVFRKSGSVAVRARGRGQMQAIHYFFIGALLFIKRIPASAWNGSMTNCLFHFHFRDVPGLATWIGIGCTNGGPSFNK